MSDDETDIVTKLRDRFAPQDWLRDRCFDAADEIERLREALRLTRRALKEEIDHITDELKHSVNQDEGGRPTYCDKVECLCYLPQCAEHGCMDADTSKERGEVSTQERATVTSPERGSGHE